MMHPTIDIKTFLKPGVRAHLAGIGGVSMCPLAEVLLGMEWDEESDIWGVACIAMELFTGDLLFQTVGVGRRGDA